MNINLDFDRIILHLWPWKRAIDRITHAMENGDYVWGVFLDFSKAFDMVHHNILMQKMELIGIRG